MTTKRDDTARRRTVGALLFPGFELLDVFGPLEMFGVLGEHFEVVTVAATHQDVASAQGPRAATDRSFAEAGQLDVLLVPGGRGTRSEVDNKALISFLQAAYPGLEYLASVCTGAGLLAAAGLLDGRRATSNKQSFAWAKSQGPATQWVPEARWVADGNVWTSGGVAAGMDMALALVAEIIDGATARRVAEYSEYDWHVDADWDPFARLAGLV